MQVDSGITKCAVFIGMEVQNGFHAEGSGFVLRVPEDEWAAYYIVTARHVVDAMAKSKDGSISIRINRKGKSPVNVPTKKDDWVFHDDKSIDVAVYNLDMRKINRDEDIDLIPLMADDTIYYAIMTQEKENFFGVNLGDEVFMVGAFAGRIGERKNIPVVRIGNIAALPAEEPVSRGSPKRPAYLIETRSLGGTSGAPVFLNLKQFRTHKQPSLAERLGAGQMAIHPALVIAMIIASHGGQYLSDFVSEDDTDIKFADSNFNAGISVALPIALIMETINCPKLVEARQASAKELQARSGRLPRGIEFPDAI